MQLYLQHCEFTALKYYLVVYQGKTPLRHWCNYFRKGKTACERATLSSSNYTIICELFQVCYDLVPIYVLHLPRTVNVYEVTETHCVLT